MRRAARCCPGIFDPAHPYRQRAVVRERGRDRDPRCHPRRRHHDRHFPAQPGGFLFRPPAGVPQGDGRAQLRRFGLPPADLHRKADRGNSRLRRAIRHPLVQVLHVRHARHREIGDRRRSAARLSHGRLARPRCRRLRALRDRRADRPGAQRAAGAQTRGHARRLGGRASGHGGSAGDPDRALSRQDRRRASLRRASVQPPGARGRSRRAARRHALHGRDHDALSRDQQPRSERLPGQDGAAGAHARASDRAVGRVSAKARSTRSAPTTPRACARPSGRRPVCMASRPGLPALGTHLPALLHYGRAARRSARDAGRARDPQPRPGSTASIRRRARSRSAPTPTSWSSISSSSASCAPRTCRACRTSRRSKARRLRGWPVATIKGGKIIARDGKIVAKANGRYLPRKPAPARQFEWFGRATA